MSLPLVRLRVLAESITKLNNGSKREHKTYSCTHSNGIPCPSIGQEYVSSASL
jgi:hypothetical protein